jgi:hypothetical protein
MKVLVDENVPRTTVNYLRGLGYDVKGRSRDDGA